LSKVNNSMGDLFGFIQKNTNALADHIEQEIINIPNEFIQLNQLNGVILSGRGFKFEPLVAALKVKFGPNRVVEALNPKSVCIKGAFSNHRFNGNCNMIGIPYVAVTVGNTKQTLQQPPPPPSWREKLKNLWQPKHHLEIKSNYYRDIQGFLKGYGNTYLNTQEAAIFVSGQEYQHNLPPTNGEVNLFFTGKDFIVRTQDHVAILIPPSPLATVLEHQFAAKTLFPALNEDGDLPLDPIA
jgi:hypothetical protein